MERTLTSIQLADKVKKRQLTIYNWVKAGVPHDKIMNGKMEEYRFNYDEVIEWLEHQRRG